MFKRKICEYLTAITIAGCILFYPGSKAGAEEQTTVMAEAETGVLPIVYVCNSVPSPASSSDIALIPMPVRIGLTGNLAVDGARVFEFLQKRSLPVYGHSAFAVKNGKPVIEMDAERCHNAFWIATEVSANFALLGDKKVEFLCNGKRIEGYDSPTFTTYVAVYPLWQAIRDEDLVHWDAWVSVNGELISFTEFRSRLGKKDKKIIALVDEQLKNGNEIVQIGLLDALGRKKWPDFENRILPLLSSGSENVRLAAAKALSGSNQPQIVANLKKQMAANDPSAEKIQEICLTSENNELASEAIVKRILSSNDSVVQHVMEMVKVRRQWPLLAAHYEDFAKIKTAHFIQISEALIENAQAEPVQRALSVHDLQDQAVIDNRLSLARHAAQAYPKMPLFQDALAFIAQYGAFHEAIRAVEKLEAAESDKLFSGLLNTSPIVRQLAARQLAERGTATALPALKSCAETQKDSAFACLSASANILLRKGEQSIKNALNSKIAAEKSAGLLALGLSRPSDAKRLESFCGQPELCGAALAGLAMSGESPEKVRELVKSHLYDNDPGTRIFVAQALGYLDDSYQAERVALLQDSDDNVVVAAMEGIAQSGRTLFAKEIIGIARRGSETVRIGALSTLPRLMDADNAGNILAFASNEIFDDRLTIKWSALRSVSDIAKLSKDAIIQNNAISALALTAQDKSPVIASATLLALARTHHQEAIPLIEQGLNADVTLEAALDGISEFPHLQFISALQQWLSTHATHPMRSKAESCLEHIK